MSEKRFSTNGYYINDTFYDGIKWLVNEVEAKEIVDVMNNLDMKARERSKALSKLQKSVDEQQELIEELQASDEMGWKRAEMFEKKCPKELHNKKMYIKRLEYKVQKFKEENEQLRKTMNEVIELLVEEVDLFSDKATEHDIIAYKEMNDFDNKDAYYMCISTKKAIKMLQRCL